MSAFSFISSDYLSLTCRWNGTSIRARCRPDFLLWVGDVLMFWGEEKSGSSGAKEDLEKKFQLIQPTFFGEIQFMITYALNGSNIRFYAADGSPQAMKRPDPFIPLTDELNILRFESRVEILRTIINIGRILLTIKDILPAITYPMAKKRKLGVSEITYYANCVTKKIVLADLPCQQGNSKRRVSFLAEMYAHARGHRGLVQVSGSLRLNNAGTHYEVELKTRGIQYLPKNEGEIQQMTKDLVSGLAWLHRGQFLHRDIRLPNIVYDRTNRQYVLIDFEHGDRQPAPRNEKKLTQCDFLKEWDHETLDGDTYTSTSDMRQLRKLLRQEFGGIILSDHGRDFVARLGAMTAEESLQHEWIHSIP